VISFSFGLHVLRAVLTFQVIHINFTRLRCATTSSLEHEFLAVCMPDGRAEGACLLLKCCSIGSLTTAVYAILYTVVYFVIGGLCMTHHARCSHFIVFELGVVGSWRDLVPQPLLAQPFIAE
jgi:hypothetical protein